MKKSYLIAGVTIIALILLLFLVLKPLLQKPSEPVLGDNITFTEFTSEDTPIGRAAVSVPFLKTLDSVEFIGVAIDLNNDGDYSQEEWLIQNVPIRTKGNWNNNFYFITPLGFAGANKARVVLGTEQKDVDVIINPFEVGNLLDLATVTNPEESMKGVGLVFAENGAEVDISIEDVPDIGQNPGECAPTTAANSLVHLIQKNGEEENLPEDLNDFLEELKNDMNWTREDGVLPDDFVTGKNAWAQRHNLPITTEKVGDQHGIDTLDAIQEALNQGQGVELRLKFGDPETGKAVGGHMVTVTGMRKVNGDTYLDIHDPASPFGTDVVKIERNQFADYGLFNGWTIMSWGFIQKWEEPAVSVPSEGEQPPSESEEEAPGQAIEPPSFSVSYEHVKPGEYSEVYVDVQTQPGTQVVITLTGPGVTSNLTQSGPADSSGKIRLTWQINMFGEYNAVGVVGGQPVSSSITVE